jgi:translation initiation factor 1
VVKGGRETKGRGGKGVTIISDLPMDEKSLAELATNLKIWLGTGGTVKNGRIEIQSDHREYYRFAQRICEGWNSAFQDDRWPS